jgi:putative transcription factor
VLLLLCEVCGRQIFGDPFRTVIEGANMTVCSRCSKLGSGVWEPKSKPRLKKSMSHQPIQTYSRRKQIVAAPVTLELVENVGLLVRQARDDLGISHEDLGRQIRERVSVLRKIESGKLVPDLALAEKLEHTLKIKLRIPPIDPKAQLNNSSKPQGTTLGDLIKIKFKGEEEEN